MMKNNINEFIKTYLFSCPIYQIRIDPNSYDKEKIINDIKYNKSLKNTRNDPHQNIGGTSDTHHSYRDFDNENFRSINYEKLQSVYLKMIKEFFEKEIQMKKTVKTFKYKVEFLNYSAITEGQWLPFHNHLGAGDDFACIHYLNFKDDHVHTTFNNPINFTPFLKFIQPELYDILDNRTSDNSYLEEYFGFPAEEDDMLIFPTALNHQCTMQGPTKEPRITISSNIKLLEERQIS